MCGIAGFYKCNVGERSLGLPELESMAELLSHRGPDGKGFYQDDYMGMAHTRLSIIDIDGGNQPIHNEDSTIWIVFNGEIFNYIELREELIKKGHEFYTKSDTEVIVHAYEEFGLEFPEHLNGQFAIAIWDSNKKQTILARDRVGIHPLFYTEKNGQFIFASEIKAILQVLPESPTLNPVSLDQLMTFWSVVGENTIFSKIFQVRPGEILVVKKDSIEKKLYWDFRYPADSHYNAASEVELAEELYSILMDATRIRLRSDVPVGAYLSGGLDSSVLTTLMYEQNTSIRTFSIGFSDEKLDESDYQKIMIGHIGAKHSNIRCSSLDVGRAFINTIWHTESPVLRTAPVPMKLLSALVHEKNYKVVLTGEGADEVLGGYDIFKEAKIRAFWAKNPRSKIRPMLLKRLYPYLDVSPGKAQSYLEAFFGIGLENPELVYFSHLPRWKTTSHCKAFFSDEFKLYLNEIATDTLAKSFPADMRLWHPFNRAQYIEAKTLMSGYLLSSQGDRMLMANSVEGRFPFLDHRVIEFAGRLHPKYKMKALNEKFLLKKAMGKHLPQAIINRYKQPYRAPDIPSFFDGNIPLDFVGELLDENVIRKYGYFDEKKVSMMLKKIKQGRAIGYKDNMAFVGILSTQIWHNLFIEN